MASKKFMAINLSYLVMNSGTLLKSEVPAKAEKYKTIAGWFIFDWFVHSCKLHRLQNVSKKFGIELENVIRASQVFAYSDVSLQMVNL